MDLNNKRKLDILRKEFEYANMGINPVIRLTQEIGVMFLNLTDKEFKTLIEIPRSVLSMDLEINESKLEIWQSDNSKHFSGCISCINDPFFTDLNKKFKEKTYSVEDIVRMIDYISDNFNVIASNHSITVRTALNIVECTLKDGIIVDNVLFLAGNKVFAKQIEKAIKL